MKTKSYKKPNISNTELNQLSKESLQIALFRLMGEKSFQDITISEIAEKAGVSRNAFYRNYGTKEALFEAMNQQIITVLNENAPDPNKIDRTSCTRFFRIIRDNKKDFQLLLEGKHPFLDIIKKPHPDYATAARAGAFAQIAINWFTLGMKETPEEMGILCEKIFNG